MGLREKIKEGEDFAAFFDEASRLGHDPTGEQLLAAAKRVKQAGRDPADLVEYYQGLCKRAARKELGWDRQKLNDQVRELESRAGTVKLRRTKGEDAPETLDAEDAATNEKLFEVQFWLGQIDERERALSEDGQQQGGG